MFLGSKIGKVIDPASECYFPNSSLVFHSLSRSLVCVLVTVQSLVGEEFCGTVTDTVRAGTNRQEQEKNRQAVSLIIQLLNKGRTNSYKRNKRKTVLPLWIWHYNAGAVVFLFSDFLSSSKCQTG